MLLSGHAGEVTTAKFSPTGRLLASGSFDQAVLVWEVYNDCRNTATLKGHRGSVLEVAWSADGAQIASCASDKTAAAWDVETLVRLRRMRGHAGIVNSAHVARDLSTLLVVTGADDGATKVRRGRAKPGGRGCTAALTRPTTQLWDLRQRREAHSFAHRYPRTAVSFGADATRVFSAGIDADITAYDVRAAKALYTMSGHTVRDAAAADVRRILAVRLSGACASRACQDTVTGIRLSADGTRLLSNAADRTVRAWDVQPFAPGDRCTGQYLGAAPSQEGNLVKCAWSADGQRVGAGSGDQFVYVWRSATHEIEYKLPGHTGCVNEVDFHPQEPIGESGAGARDACRAADGAALGARSVLSCGSDKKIYLGEMA